MRNLILAIAVLATALSMSACNLMSKQVYGHESVKLNFVGGNMNGSTGVSLGQGSVTVNRAPHYAPTGSGTAAQNKVQSTCGGEDVPNSYANMNNKATASATASPVSVAKGVGSISAPSIAISTGDEAADGCAAAITAAAKTPDPAATLRAAFNHPDATAKPATAPAN